MSYNVKNYDRMHKEPGTVYYFIDNKGITVSDNFYDLLVDYRELKRDKRHILNDTIYALPTYFHRYSNKSELPSFQRRWIHTDGRTLFYEYYYDNDGRVYFYDYTDKENYYPKLIDAEPPYFEARPVKTDNVDKFVRVPGTVYITENGYASYDFQDAINHLKKYRDDYGPYRKLEVYGVNLFNIDASYNQDRLNDLPSLKKSETIAKLCNIRTFELSLDRTHIYRETGATDYVEDYYIIDADIAYGDRDIHPELVYKIKDEYKDQVDEEFRDNLFVFYYYGFEPFKDINTLRNNISFYAETCIVPYTISLNRPHDKRRKRKLVFDYYYTENIPFIFFEECEPKLNVNDYFETEFVKRVLDEE